MTNFNFSWLNGIQTMICFLYTLLYYIWAMSCERWAMSYEGWGVSDERNWKTSGNCDWERVEPSLLGLCRAWAIWTKSKTGKWIAAGFQTRGIRIYTYICRLQRRESVVRVAVPRLCRRTFHPCNYFHGFKNPRLFALRASRPSDAFRWRMSDKLSNE